MLAEEIQGRLLPHIKKMIDDRSLDLGIDIDATHGHLGFHDEKYSGHYVSALNGGLVVDVKLNDNTVHGSENFKGDTRPSIDVFVPLDIEYRQKLTDLLTNNIKELEIKMNNESDGKEKYYLQQSIAGLSNSLHEIDPEMSSM
jgi:hypothetical protein